MVKGKITSYIKQKLTDIKNGDNCAFEQSVSLDNCSTCTRSCADIGTESHFN